MERKIVHVVGTGTIGEPLIGILCEQKSNLGIDEVTFHKQSPLTKDAPKIKNLIAKGARLAVHEKRVESFKKIGLEPEFTMEEAVSRSSVVIDCTPKGFGHQNKLDFYEIGERYFAQEKFKPTKKELLISEFKEKFGSDRFPKVFFNLEI